MYHFEYRGLLSDVGVRIFHGVREGRDDGEDEVDNINKKTN